MKIDFANDMFIDPEALDIEWLKQPELEMAYIENLSNLRRGARDAEEEVKTIRSELVREALWDPKGCCNGKATAPAIEAYYRTHPEYKAAKEEAIAAGDAYEVAKDMKDAVHFTRTKALENLVTLHGQQYFAGPRVPRNLSKSSDDWKKAKEEAASRRKSTNKKIGSKMRRKK